MIGRLVDTVGFLLILVGAALPLAIVVVLAVGAPGVDGWVR